MRKREEAFNEYNIIFDLLLNECGFSSRHSFIDTFKRWENTLITITLNVIRGFFSPFQSSSWFPRRADQNFDQSHLIQCDIHQIQHRIHWCWWQMIWHTLWQLFCSFPWQWFWPRSDWLIPLWCSSFGRRRRWTVVTLLVFNTFMSLFFLCNIFYGQKQDPYFRVKEDLKQSTCTWLSVWSSKKWCGKRYFSKKKLAVYSIE